MLGSSEEKPPKPNGPDFSAIDSRAKAVELFERGDLEKLFLMPLEFGGVDNAGLPHRHVLAQCMQPVPNVVSVTAHVELTCRHPGICWKAEQ